MELYFGKLLKRFEIESMKLFYNDMDKRRIFAKRNKNRYILL